MNIESKIIKEFNYLINSFISLITYLFNFTKNKFQPQPIFTTKTFSNVLSAVY